MSSEPEDGLVSAEDDPKRYNDLAASRDRFMRDLAKIIIEVAGRHPGLRGPWIFDEAELQANAKRARAFLARN